MRASHFPLWFSQTWSWRSSKIHAYMRSHACMHARWSSLHTMIICCVESHYSEDTYHLFLDGPKKPTTKRKTNPPTIHPNIMIQKCETERRTMVTLQCNIRNWALCLVGQFSDWDICSQSPRQPSSSAEKPFKYIKICIYQKHGS